MNYVPKRDDGKQHKRQSKDFKEIWNIQSDLVVDEVQWDSIFHNYEHPEQCEGRKRPSGCSICDKLTSH